MNIILFEASEISDAGTLILAGARFEHLRDVLKVGEGDQVRVGMIDGDRGSGEVRALSAVEVELQVVLNLPPLPRHPTTLVLALPRPKMLRRVLRSCAEFGVQDIHLINSYRVEKSFWQSPLLRPQRLRQALLAGLERAGDTRLPRVQCHQRFKPFIEDELKSLLGAEPFYIAHPGPYPMLDPSSASRHWVAIGPEGGFIPFELDLMSQQGGQLCSLGEHILSVDTTVPAVLGRALR